MADITLRADVAVTVPINIAPLIDATDFKTIEDAVTYNQAGLVLEWNFCSAAGVVTQTAVTPTDTGGAYDWVNNGTGMYEIEIPASGGASANNDTEGTGWFSGFATGVLPFRGPTIAFCPDAVVDILDGSASVGVAQTADHAASVASILEDTAEIGAAGAGLTEAGGTGDQLTAVPWNASWDAEVQSEVQDALDATVAEPGQGAPAATASIVTKIGYLYKAWRNKKEQTATEQKLYNDDGSTVGQKATVSDDATTATVGEMGTGA